jgi:hypothetical protein
VFFQRACSNIEKRGDEEGDWRKKEGKKVRVKRVGSEGRERTRRERRFSV